MKRPITLLLIAGTSVVSGLAMWLYLAWQAVNDLGSVTPQSGAGGNMIGWALCGTLLMIAGMIVLHFAADAAEQEGKDAEVGGSQEEETR